MQSQFPSSMRVHVCLGMRSIIITERASAVDINFGAVLEKQLHNVRMAIDDCAL